MKKWLKGHKAFLAAWILLGIAVGLTFLGMLSPGEAGGGAILLIGLFGESYRADLERHKDEVIQVLQEIALAGRETSVRNVPAALQAGTQAVEDGAKLAQECEQENKS